MKRFCTTLLPFFPILCMGDPPSVETAPLSEEWRALSPEDALASMRVPEGYRVELVAAEPLVEDPVAFDWGPDGRLWVAEMRDYPNGQTWHKPGDPLDEPGGRIKVLADTNGDGRYDSATVFLDGLSYPTGVKVWGKGVLVTAAPEIFYAEDTDGDGTADRREVWYEGFARANQQHRVNGLAWGLDNWLHVANGDGGGVILSQERREEVDIRGFDLRLNPFTREHEPLNGRTQCGRFGDDWGNWFGCNNSNPLWHYPYSWHLLRRNPEVRVARAYVDVPREPGAAPVFPASPTLERFNDFDRANRFTSACGPTIYRDTVLGEGVSGNAFTCEPVHNLVSRQVLEPRGATFVSDRHPDERESEFFASTDPWSRPVAARTGPEGGLWIADMYRFVIEHPEWIPQEWQKKLEMRAGAGRGRIYRVVPDAGPSPEIPRLDHLDAAGLVARLESGNGTVRDLAHQMLLWLGGKEPVTALVEMALSGKSPLARVHALCVLDGLGELETDTLFAVLAENHPGVVRHAVRLARGRVPAGELAGLPERMRDDAFVAIELAALLGEEGSGPESDAAWLADLLSRHGDDPHAVPVLLSAVNRENLAPLVAKLTQPNPRWRNDAVLPELGRFAARWGDARSLGLLAAYVVGEDGPDQDRRLALLSGLFEGGATVDSLAGGGTLSAALRELLDDARARASDAALGAEARAAAVRFLGQPAVFDGDGDFDRLLGLLAPQTPPALREAAFEALARVRHPGTAQALGDRWAALPPSDRSRALALLLGRSDWTAALLDSIEAGAVPRGEVDAASRRRLLESPDAAVRERARPLFESAADASREEVLAAHADVAAMKGDAATGKSVFGAACAACHDAGPGKNPVGPDLAGLNDRSPETLLVAVLDPNRAVEDRYVNYAVTTTEGDMVYGVVADESSNALRIRQADGTARALARGEIASMASTGVSLMPEGFEKILSKQQLADLFAYLATLGSDEAAPPRGNVDMAARVGLGADGTARLRASRCRLDGERLRYDETSDAIEGWGAESDRIQWTLVLDRPGEFRVEWDASAPEDGPAEKGWCLEIGGREVFSGAAVEGPAPGAGFVAATLGVVELAAADHLVVLRSQGPTVGPLPRPRELRFVRMPAEQP